jgi:hypothetical protein
MSPHGERIGTLLKELLGAFAIAAFFSLHGRTAGRQRFQIFSDFQKSSEFKNMIFKMFRF